MAVFRIEKTKDYTVMANHHLRNRALSLKAKGLLSLMLSLPDDWDYTTKGLSRICKDGVDSISATVRELETAGYVKRRRLRNAQGQLAEVEYTILEQPGPAADGLTDGWERRAEIMEQIEYKFIRDRFNRDQLDELVEIMLEVAMNRSPTIRIGRDAEYPTGFVQQRFEQITSMHIEKVMDGIRENTTRVWNTRAYLLAALFNSVSTIDNHYTMLVNHDFHSGP